MQERCVVIVGASSGIGQALAAAAARSGFRVFGTFRSAPGEEQPGVEWLNVDLDRVDGPTLLRAELEARGCKSVHALVHCAGVCVPSPVDVLSRSDFEETFNVNVFSPLLVTSHLLDLMAPSSRVVYLGSVSGRVTVPMLGLYSASKFALRAFVSAQRSELRARGIQVALVEAGNIRTQIWDRSERRLAEMAKDWGPAVKEYYGPVLNRVGRLSKRAQAGALPVEDAIESIVPLLYRDALPSLVRVGRDAWLWWAIERVIPTRLRDWALCRALQL